jgi:hypothetical protein
MISMAYDTSAEGNGFPTGGHGKKVFVPKFQDISG